MLNNFYLYLRGATFVLICCCLTFTNFNLQAQSDSPCECASRWEEGGHWNADGSIVDGGNIPDPQGIIRCGNAADTQSNVSSCVSPGVESNLTCTDRCVYDSDSFEIDLSGITCFDPNNPGTDPGVTAPADGCDIMWLQLDVRAFAGTWQFQLVGGSQEYDWALYASTSVDIDGDPMTGCDELSLQECGSEFSNTWSTITTPSFVNPTNYYMAVWNTGPDCTENLSINFKFRNGCGDAACFIELADSGTSTTCNTDGTYDVCFDVQGANGEFDVVDNTGQATNVPADFTLGLFPDGPFAETVCVTYPLDVDYNVSIVGLSLSNSNNPCEEQLDYSGTGIASCSQTTVQACDDGDPCTENDMETVDDCNAGFVCVPCAGTPIAACSLTTTLPCDDGDPCTENDEETIDDCDGSVCVPCAGTPIAACILTTVQACDDGDPCTENDEETIDDCDGSVCVPCAGTPVAACSLTTVQACDDGDPCTENDEETIDDCDGSVCVPCAGTPIAACSQTTVQACDDGDPCTENDIETIDDCDGAVCVPCAGMPVAACSLTTVQACDDGNPCTDNDEETIDDCDGSVCVPCAGTPVAACSLTTVQACDDGDPCTDNDEETIDDCDGSVCVPCAGTPVAACTLTTVQACDDGDPCTDNDEETIDDCDGSVCVPCAGTPLAACTLTTVQACDDGDPCTENDEETIDDCDGSVCVPCAGTPIAACSLTTTLPCDDGDPCTENDEVTTDDCSGEICEPCAGTPIAACTLTTVQACNDGDPCTENDEETIDDCDGSVCVPCAGTPIAVCTLTTVQACDDGDPCTENDEETIDDCDGSVCVPCAGTPVAACSLTTVQACDDGDPCTENDVETIDDCSGEVCVPCAGTPIAACTLTTVQACDDGDPCTENDEETIDDCDGSVCVPCAGTPIAACTLTTVQACDDGDPCTENDEETIDDCDGAVCVPCAGTPVAACSLTTVQACDDGNPCTENDEETIDDCDGSVCVPCAGTPIAVCTLTTVQACDDGDPCTENDEETIDDCDGSVCVPCAGTPIAACSQTTVQACDDGDPCTENDVETIDDCSGEVCVPCAGTPVATCTVTTVQACDDGDPCTENDMETVDACSWEICIPCAGTPVVPPVCDPDCEVYNEMTCSCDPIQPIDCDDGDECTTDIWDETTCTCTNVFSCDNDSIPPTIVWNNPLLTDIEDGGIYYAECDALPFFGAGDVTATDNCDQDVDVSMVDFGPYGMGNDCEEQGFIKYFYCIWTATDDCGNTSTLSIYIYIVDTTPPVFVDPPGNLCGENALTPQEYLDYLDNLPTLTATDNCSSVTVTGPDIANYAPCSNRRFLTWTAMDECGNITTHRQVVCIKAPRPTCADITYPDEIICGETVDFSVNPTGGLPPYTIRWKVIGGDWTINGSISGTSVSVTAGSGTAIIRVIVTDAKGCRRVCKVTVSCTEPPAEYCTFTQGYYGNYGGTQNGQTTIEILENALSANGGSITLGLPGQSLTITDADCIIGLLPNFGGSSPLASGDEVLSTSDCSTSFSNLAAQTLTLTLNTLYDPALSGLSLEDSCLPFSDAIYEALGQNPTVGDLLDLANQALGGAYTGNLGEITDALGLVNDGYDECQTVSDVCAENGFKIDNNPDFGNGVCSDKESICNMIITPNITSNWVQVNYTSEYDLESNIRLLTADGAVLSETQSVANQGFNQETIDLSQLPSGMYFVVIQVRGERLVQKVIKTK